MMKASDKLLDEISKLLSTSIDSQLVSDLITEFTTIKQDFLTGTLGRGSPGKFVETVVQIMQFLENGHYDKKPSVDAYLRDIENRSTSLSDSLKLLVSKIARSVYALRNKRGIGHKGEVNPNFMDLKYIFSACQWVLAELLRLNSKKHPDEAEKLIESILITPSIIIEDFGDFKTVLYRQIPSAKELLILLHSYHPEYVAVEQIYKDMKRRSKRTISGAIGVLYKKALIEGSKENGYKITTSGYKKAIQIISNLSKE